MAELNVPGHGAPRIGLISPCGWGNLGDAAILDSLISAARRRLPGVSLIAFTMNPSDTTERHAIESMPLSGFERPGYRVDGERPDPDPGPIVESVVTPGWRGVVRRVAGLPGVRDVATATRLLRADRRYGRDIDRVAGSLAQIVVAGGGQFDEFWGGPLGHPYVLARWSRRARRLGVPFRILSVGTGTLDTRLSRLLARDAIKHATTVSFRDPGSRALVGEAAASAAVVPDLAYGLEVDRVEVPVDAPITVGLSPMSYRDPRFWAEPGIDQYETYIRRFGELGRLVLERGHDVVVLSTNRSDDVSVQDLVAAIRDDGDGDPGGRLRVVATPGHHEYLAAVGQASSVVASRLHGVILAHLVGRPVLALSYDRKVGAVMHEVDHDEFCLDIDDFEPAAAAALLDSMLERRAQLEVGLVEFVDGRSRTVNAQYDDAFVAL